MEPLDFRQKSLDFRLVMGTDGRYHLEFNVAALIALIKEDGGEWYSWALLTADDADELGYVEYDDFSTIQRGNWEMVRRRQYRWRHTNSWCWMKSISSKKQQTNSSDASRSS